MIGFGFTISLNDAFSNVADKIVDKFSQIEGMSDKAMQRVQAGAKKFETGLGTMAVGAAVLTPLALAVKTSMDFNKAVSEVGAVANANAEDLKRLKEQAMELGESTSFTAKQVAEGQKYLAMAGFNVNDTLGAMPGLLSLAAAGNIELGEAADLASNAMSIFGIKASEANKMSDLLAKASTTSNTTIRSIGESVKYFAGAIGTYKVSSEESVAAIGLLGNAGFQGSVATMALGTSLARLSKPTKEMREEMEKTNTVFFQEGKFIGLAGVIEQVERATANMTQESKAAYLNTIFGAEATKQIVALLGAEYKVMENGVEVTKRGSEAMKAYTNSLQNAGGAADEMARRQLDNLAGSFTYLSSAAEGLLINIGDKLEPIVKVGVDALTGFLGVVNSIVKSPFGDFIVGAVAVVGSFLTVLGAGIAVAGVWKMAMASIIPVIKAAGAALSTAIGAPLMPIIVGLAALAAAVYFVKRSWQSFTDLMSNKSEPASGGIMRLMQTVGGVLQGIGELFSSASMAGFSFSQEMYSAFERLGIAEFMVAIGTFASRVASFFKGFKDGYALYIEPSIQGLKKSFSSVFSAFDPLFNAFSKVLGVIMNQFSNASSGTTDWADAGMLLGKVFGVAIDIIAGGLKVVAMAIETVSGVIGGLMTSFADTFQNIMGLVEQFKEGFISLPDFLLGIGGQIVGALWNGIANSWQWLTDNFMSLIAKLPFGKQVLEFAGVNIGGSALMSDTSPMPEQAQSSMLSAPLANVSASVLDSAINQNAQRLQVGNVTPNVNNQITVQPTPVTLMLDGEVLAKNIQERNENEKLRY